MNNIVLVIGDDWQAVYLNGWLDCSGHSVDAEDILNIIQNLGEGEGIQSKTAYVDMDWLHEEGNLPEKLEDVKLEKEEN